jgi:hypothetical protein
VVAYLPKGETYADLACGFAIGTSTVYRYLREALEVLAAMSPTLAEAIEVAREKAYVILDGTLLRIDRVGMTGRRDRPFYSGKHKCTGSNSVLPGLAEADWRTRGSSYLGRPRTLVTSGVGLRG